MVFDFICKCPHCGNEEFDYTWTLNNDILFVCDDRKYKIRYDLTLQFEGRTLYRIEALKDFSDVKKGDLGDGLKNSPNLLFLRAWRRIGKKNFF